MREHILDRYVDFVLLQPIWRWIALAIIGHACTFAPVWLILMGIPLNLFIGLLIDMVGACLIVVGGSSTLLRFWNG